MTTKDEALKLALDALHARISGAGRATEAEYKAAMACRAALAQKYEQEPFGYFNNPNLDDWQSCAETDDGAIALYEHPKEPLTDWRLKVKMGGWFGADLSGHWFYLTPADEHAEAAIAKHTGIGAAK